MLRRPHEAVLSSAKIFVGWSGPRPGFASFDHSASTPLLPAPDGRSWFCRFSPSAGLCGSAAASSASSTCGRKWALPSRCWTLFAASSSSSSHSPVPGVLHRRLAPGSRDSLRRGGGSAAEGGGHSGGLPFSSRLLCALFSRAKAGWLASHHRPQTANILFIDCTRFRLVTLRDVSLLLQPGIWTASIGLDDEFFHVAVDTSSRRFLRFCWRGRIWLFCDPSLRSVPRSTHPYESDKDAKALLPLRGIRSFGGWTTFSSWGRPRRGQGMPFLGLGWSSTASSVFVDEKRLSVSRAASTRPGVIPVVAFGVSSAGWRRRSGGSYCQPSPRSTLSCGGQTARRRWPT